MVETTGLAPLAIVLVEGGRDTGDHDFNGSDVTLFGEGTGGRDVVLEGRSP